MIARTVTVRIDDDSCHAEFQDPEYPESYELIVYASTGVGWAMGDNSDADTEYFATFDEARRAFVDTVTFQLKLELEEAVMLID
jgi:hypothetical protein